MPRECLKIIESKSKVRQSRSKAIVSKVNTSSSTPAVSSDVAELKDMVRALILDKKNQTPPPAPVKAVEQRGGFRDCRALIHGRSLPYVGSGAYCALPRSGEVPTSGSLFKCTFRVDDHGRLLGSSPFCGFVGSGLLGCTETPPRCRMTFPKRGETGKRGETPGKRPQEKGKRF
ncbi:hypothetical protein Tco_0739449 [Tanacetum coccineum]